MGRAMVNSDRALKNLPSKNTKLYIKDHFKNFNDMQKIRALLIINDSIENSFITKLRDEVVSDLNESILQGAFEFKKGNAMATFA